MKDTKLLTLTMPNFINGIIHLTLLELSIIILGISRRKLGKKSWTVGCAGWPGSIHWWQRLTTVGSGRIRVKNTIDTNSCCTLTRIKGLWPWLSQSFHVYKFLCDIYQWEMKDNSNPNNSVISVILRYISPRSSDRDNRGFNEKFTRQYFLILSSEPFTAH